MIKYIFKLSLTKLTMCLYFYSFMYLYDYPPHYLINKSWLVATQLYDNMLNEHTGIFSLTEL